MRLAAVQVRATRGELSGNRSRLARLAAQAATESDLVVLPEMAASGYLFRDAAAVASVAEPPCGPTWSVLAPIAASARCWMVCGFVEAAGDRFFNSALVIDPSGALAFTYRKTLLFDADHRWATPGDSGYQAFDADWGSFGVGICMDLNDDAFVAWAARSRLSAVALPTNWLDEGLSVWPYWRWRLGPAGVLVAANTWGSEELDGEVTPFAGQSAILDARGLYAAAPAVGHCVLRAVIAR